MVFRENAYAFHCSIERELFYNIGTFELYSLSFMYRLHVLFTGFHELYSKIAWPHLSDSFGTDEGDGRPLSLSAVLRRVLHWQCELGGWDFPLVNSAVDCGSHVAWGVGKGRSLCEQLIWQHFAAREEKSIIFTNDVSSHGAPSILCVLGTEGRTARIQRLLWCKLTELPPLPLPSYFRTSWYKQTEAVITEGEADSF